MRLSEITNNTRDAEAGLWQEVLVDGSIALALELGELELNMSHDLQFGLLAAISYLTLCDVHDGCIIRAVCSYPRHCTEPRRTENRAFTTA